MDQNGYFGQRIRRLLVMVAPLIQIFQERFISQASLLVQLLKFQERSSSMLFF